MITAAAVVAVYFLLQKNVQLFLPGTPTQGGGITSLAHLKNEDGSWLIFCGTKKGSVRILSLIDDSTNYGVQHYAEFNVTDNKHPIFSMTVDEDDHTVFCGASDRFVTILQPVNTNIADQHDIGKKWRTDSKHRLGPHTGWVQDVLLSSPDNLYSIGCNCIESWQKQPDRQWKQGKRRVVDSDVELGCTLSSDLLCLAQTKDCLMAGGVDGRVHVFGINGHSATAAHNGRVNAMMTTTTHGVDHVVSVSHDGWVYKWSVQQEKDQLSLRRVHAFQSKERNTAIASFQLQKNEKEEWFAVGTSQGTILLLSNSLDLLATYQLPKASAITSLLHLPHLKKVLVAHSLGLGAFEYDVK